MNLKLKINLNTVAIVLLSSWYLVPYVSTTLGALGFVALFVLWVLTSNLRVLVSSLKAIPYMSFAVWYVLVLFTMALGLYSGTSNILYYLLMSFAFAVPAVFWEYYKSLGNDKLIAFFAKIVIILVILCSVMTVSVLIAYPDAAKKLAMGDSFLDDVQFYYSLGCGGFGNIYGFVVLFVPLIFYRAENKLWRFLKTAAVILGFVSVIMSLYTIALLLILVSASVCFLINIYKKNVALGLVLTVAIIVLVFFLGNILGMISDLLASMGLGDTALRVRELIDALSGNSEGYNLGSRIDKYGTSLGLFFKHPLLGNQLFGSASYGGHSSVFDELARYGFFMYFFRIVFIKKTFDRQRVRSTAVLIVPFIIYAVIALLNPTIYIYQIGYCLLFGSGVLLRKNKDENTVD